MAETPDRRTRVEESAPLRSSDMTDVAGVQQGRRDADMSDDKSNARGVRAESAQLPQSAARNKPGRMGEGGGFPPRLKEDDIPKLALLVRNAVRPRFLHAHVNVSRRTWQEWMTTGRKLLAEHGEDFGRMKANQRIYAKLALAIDEAESILGSKVGASTGRGIEADPKFALELGSRLWPEEYATNSHQTIETTVTGSTAVTLEMIHNAVAMAEERQKQKAESMRDWPDNS